MEPLDWISELHQAVVESGDPRTNQWPLVRSPVPTIYFIVLYGLISVVGSIFIKLKSPLPIQPLILAFNLFVVAASCYISKEFLVGAYLSNYNLICEPVNVTDTPLPLRMATTFWLAYLVKFTYALDTIFLILRRKSHQIPMFQVTHHISAPTAAWFMVKYAPGGQGFLHGTLNSAGCVIVYSYKAAKCHPSTKKYAVPLKEYVHLTHLIELIVTICHSLIGLFKGCFSPNWILVAVPCYSTVMLLFMTVGKSASFLNLLEKFWPSWLYGSQRIMQRMKHHPPKAP